MTSWDQRRYEEEQQNFIRRRVHIAPLWSHFTLVFAATWGAAWFCSWFLWRFVAPAHAWAGSLPLRYAVAFLFAYACFFLAVRVWIDVARREPADQAEGLDLGDAAYAASDGEGCLAVVAVLAVSFVVGGLFLAAGGAPMLLEAAFEAAFAGVVVRRPIAGDLVLGDWAAKLFANTWRQALAGFVVLLAVAAALHAKAPQAATFAQAVRALHAH